MGLSITEGRACWQGVGALLAGSFRLCFRAGSQFRRREEDVVSRSEDVAGSKNVSGNRQTAFEVVAVTSFDAGMSRLRTSGRATTRRANARHRVVMRMHSRFNPIRTCFTAARERSCHVRSASSKSSLIPGKKHTHSMSTDYERQNTDTSP